MASPFKPEVYFGAINLSPYFTERRPADWVGIDFLFIGLPKELLEAIRLLVEARALVYFSITGGGEHFTVLLQARFRIDGESIAFACSNDTGTYIFNFEGVSDA